MYTVFFENNYREFKSEFEALYFIEEELHCDDWYETDGFDGVFFFVGF